MCHPIQVNVHCLNHRLVVDLPAPEGWKADNVDGWVHTKMVYPLAYNPVSNWARRLH